MLSYFPFSILMFLYKTQALSTIIVFTTFLDLFISQYCVKKFVKISINEHTNY